jgi:hypothetical protein
MGKDDRREALAGESTVFMKKNPEIGSINGARWSS